MFEKVLVTPRISLVKDAKAAKNLSNYLVYLFTFKPSSLLSNYLVYTFKLPCLLSNYLVYFKLSCLLQTLLFTLRCSNLNCYWIHMTPSYGRFCAFEWIWKCLATPKQKGILSSTFYVDMNTQNKNNPPNRC